ncbi:MAG: amino acid permease [Streptococcus sp.]
MHIVIFYVGALIAIMAIFPWQQLPVNESPFVTVFQMVGIKWAAAFINFVVLTAAASSLNSTLYSTGRHLFQLAKETPNSKVMKTLKLDTLSRTGIPARAIIASAVVVCISAFINILPGVSDAFSLITASSSGVYICNLCFDYDCASGDTVNLKSFYQTASLCQPIRFLNPLTIAFFLSSYLFVSSYNNLPISVRLERQSG